MRTLVVVQSRLSSSRLPGKAALTLAGRPAVVLCAQRAGRAGQPVLVATSTEPEDDVVAAELAAWGIECYRGSLDDPLERFTHATAHLDDADVVVRLTADNVVPDADFVAEVVGALGDDGYVRVATGMPYGLSAEAFRVALLRQAHREARSQHDREHVTPWIRRATSDREHVPAALAGLGPEAPMRRVRCTMDNLEDYRVAHRALGSVEDPVAAPWSQLLGAWAAHGGCDPLPVTGSRPNAIGQGAWVLGTAQLGMAYGVANTTGEPTPADAGRLLAAAGAAGVTHLDTARAYGLSEERIGASLRRGLSERVRVVTKVRPLDPPSDGVGVSAGASGSPDGTGEAGEAGETGETGTAAREAACPGLALELSVEQSLRALGAARVDALLLHRWADFSRGDGVVAARLAALVERGVARVVGASLAAPEELLEALADQRVGYVQLPFNVLDRRWLAEPVQRALAARPDVIVTVRSVFLQGLLVGAADTRWPAGTGLDAAPVRDGLEAARRALGRSSVADLCLAYVRGHSFVTSVVLGAESEAQVADQADLMARAPLTSQEIETVHEHVPAGPAGLVDPSRWRFPA